MKSLRLLILPLLTLLTLLPSLDAQQPLSYAAVVPRLVSFSGKAAMNGTSVSGAVAVTFSIYSEQDGGAPLWIETQNVMADAKGNFTAQLGVTKSEGLPLDLFSTGEARWLGVRVNGGDEQPRVLLLSVPYALKAADAATLGGLPPSAFILASPASAPPAVNNSSTIVQSTSTPPPASSNVTTTGGTVNALPLFTTATNIQNSALTQKGTGTTAKIGIGTATPASTLDVMGGATVRGLFMLPSTGTATAAAGRNSQAERLVASAFSSSTNAAVNQVFLWQAEPVLNDTAAPSATINLLYGAGSSTPAETGLRIGHKGFIQFAAGQTFPGAGTITSLTAGTDLTGGGTAGAVKLNLDTTKVPQLAAANNTFTGNINVVGDLREDFSGINKGTVTPGIRFGVGNTGEGISSDRSGTVNKNGIDLYTNFTPRVSITQGGNVGIGTTAPTSGMLTAVSNSVSVVAISATGYNAVTDSGGNGYDAMHVTGGNADPDGDAQPGAGLVVTGGNAGFLSGYGAPGVIATGGLGGGFSFGSAESGGDGGDFTGGNGPGGGGAGVFGMGGSQGFYDGIGGYFIGADAVGQGGDGVDGVAGSGFAGNFTGDLNVTGAITAGTKDFKIDHPLDPANKYLVHASVESSEMKNIYDGNVTTDSQGHATVQLPTWFEALNTDFRYQLTVIGQFAQAIVARKIENNQFEVATNLPSVEVSWQVTGVRQDAFAKAHPLIVEPQKEASLRGFFIHPELHGAPQERQIEWARHPQIMKRMKERRVGSASTTRRVLRLAGGEQRHQQP